MASATFRFYEELNAFLPGHRQKRDFEVPVKGNSSIEETIASLGVPPAKVDLVLLNGRSVDFACRVRPGDRISVYPVFESLNIEQVSRLRESPLRRPRFIADRNLGEMAAVMRSLGFDVFFDPSLSWSRIVAISEKENRTILMESGGRRDFAAATRLVQVRPGPVETQIREVVDLLDLGASG